MENSLGTYLRELRTAQRMSLERVAKKARIAASTLSRWEGGAFLPRLPELDATLDALSATTEQRQRAISLVNAPRAVVRMRQEAETRAQTSGDDTAPLPCFGDLLRALRRRRGMSLEEVADSLGVRPNTVSRWEQSRIILPAEQREALCVTLAAHPEERVALLDGRLLLASPQSERKDTLDTLEADFARLRRQAERGSRALMDLRFLLLEARLWSFAQRQPSARSLLANTYTWHAQWLSWWDRYAEIGQYANRALDMARQEGSLEPFWIRAVHTSAVYAVCRTQPENPMRGLAILQDWLPAASDPECATWMLRDMADYASRAGHTETALGYIQRARTAAERTGDSDVIRSAAYVHADILVRAGRAKEALTRLSNAPYRIPFQNVLQAMKWAETLLALDEQQAAHEWLRRAYSLIETYNLTAYRPGADLLARKL